MLACTETKRSSINSRKRKSIRQTANVSDCSGHQKKRKLMLPSSLPKHGKKQAGLTSGDKAWIILNEML